MKTVGLPWIALGTVLCLGLAAVAWWLTSGPVRTASAGPAKDLPVPPSPAFESPEPMQEAVLAAAAVHPVAVDASGAPGGALPAVQPSSPPSGATAPAGDFRGGTEEMPAVGRPAMAGGSGLAPEAVTGPVLNTGAPLAAAVELSPWQSPPVNVPPGERLPALFHDTRPLPAPQRQALDSIANDFIDAVGDSAGSMSDPAEVWEAARTEADRRYIILYGFQQYDQLHRAAALEGLSEKRALSQPNP